MADAIEELQSSLGEDDYNVQERRASKHIHWISALIAVAIFGALLVIDSGFRNNAPTVFATFTGIATLYGVVFALIELKRTKAAAFLAARRAKLAAEQVARGFRLRDAAECQVCIENALRTIHEHGLVPLATLSRVTKLYASEFSTEYQDPASLVRKRVTMVESYASLRHSTRATATARVEKALLQMNSHLGSRSGDNLNSERQR